MIEADERFFFVQEFADDVLVFERGLLEDLDDNLLAHELGVPRKVNDPDAADVATVVGQVFFDQKPAVELLADKRGRPFKIDKSRIKYRSGVRIARNHVYRC